MWKYYPVDTGRKLNAHKTFRRRPARLLNVLCTFNLRSVSTRRCISFSSFSLCPKRRNRPAMFRIEIKINFWEYPASKTIVAVIMNMLNYCYSNAIGPSIEI